MNDYLISNDVFIYLTQGLRTMANVKIMAMIAILALVGSTASALMVPAMITEVSAQGNMTGSMTGNSSGMGGGNRSADSGNISGLGIPP